MAQPKVIDLLRQNSADDKIHFSFEFFPPKTDAGDEKLLASMAGYKAQQPVFIDFTWGAGGSTSDKTTALCVKCMEMGLFVNMHLTCTNMPEGKVKEALDFCQSKGIRNIVALRGDPPAGQEWQASKDGFNCALDLVKYIRANYGDYFSIGVAGYPEGHPDRIGADGNCESPEGELVYLKEKIAAGGDYIITQLFYDTQNFIEWVAQLRAAGISAPVLPGLLPFTAFGGFQRMTTLCKTRVPAQLLQQLEAIKENDEAVKQYGIDVTVEQSKLILAAGMKHLHFYTLNSNYSTFECLKKLGLFVPVA